MFVTWVLKRRQAGDEAHIEILLINMISKQAECRIWDDRKPREISVEPLYPVWLLVGWLLLSFFQNEAGGMVTVNGARYRRMRLFGSTKMILLGIHWIKY